MFRNSLATVAAVLMTLTAFSGTMAVLKTGHGQPVASLPTA